MKKLAFVLALALLAAGCAHSPVPAPAADKPRVEVRLNFEKQSGYASNQLAVWVEDASGALVKTLCVTKFTAKGGYENREDALRTWVEKAGLAGLSKGEIDALAAATPKSGPVVFTWDLTDTAGAPAPAGIYTVRVEASLRWANRVLFAAEVNTAGGAQAVDAAPTFILEAGSEAAALAEDAPELGMVSAVQAEFFPE